MSKLSALSFVCLVLATSFASAQIPSPPTPDDLTELVRPTRFPSDRGDRSKPEAPIDDEAIDLPIGEIEPPQVVWGRELDGEGPRRDGARSLASNATGRSGVAAEATAQRRPEASELNGERWVLEPHQAALPANRFKPYRHLAEIPGQYRGDWFHLLRMRFARSEIELTDQQRVAIFEVEKKIKKRTRELLREQAKVDVTAGDNGELAKANRRLHVELVAVRHQAIDEVREEVLMPAQVKRLEEINFRMKVMSQGMIETLKDDELGLQVSEEQMEAITQRADELKKEYERLVRSFKIDFQRQILLELKPQQRATIESLMGDEFQVMGDEAEPALSKTEGVKQAAMETLQRWRRKAEEGEK